MAITYEALSLMIQFGGFIVGLLGLVVTIVVALTQKKK
ncbi:putative holin-like toxin [Brevibacillus sp. WF146]|nr:putative holin-like toxin [Brevibacillus sp. WF146]UYZ14380.1 putative holin-like toxin [Brevibacillus sp. WF146]